MTDVDSLKEAIVQYEQQLAQVQATLSSSPEGTDRDNLLSLQSDIEELINLTKESLQSIESGDTGNESSTEILSDDDDDDDPLAKEYALFKAELEKVSDDSENCRLNEHAAGASNNIEEELKQLEGMKCRAPYGSSWGGVGYHNAMICSVSRSDNTEIKNMQDIKVRVLFLNPTHKEMLPCPYYLNGKCKFSDEDCRFSHGELVPLSSIREYREPDFQTIKMGSRVLAKQRNELWHRCVILKMPDKDGDVARIKFEASGNIAEVFLQNILPLDDAELEMSDTSEGTDSESDCPDYSKEEIIHKSLLTLDNNSPIGNWEKHTRGIGSKLMAQMGYVVGTGLGKHSDGRIEPVEATVLPAGKSLDHCMELRENAGGDKNLFTVERRMQKQQHKLEQQRERQYQREKQKEEKSVFNFINAALGDKPKTQSETGTSKSKSDLKTESNRQLNVASLQVGQNILRLERESSKLKESLTRHAKGSIQYNNIVMRYNEKQKELVDLRASEKNIAGEQSRRKNTAKLSIF
ncbi:PREDICTED: zinc finger CCCH-type with G patch domain-containing protein [Dufourea novaeangliae]|uniref:zinc finger CCCH-type with G patch domain-containing protein n=1 Tax=Dufourea novaeangliae TaxID=178035 RepID=UPI000766E3C3|nr:PREDICTED: zinc finger CCCH-type with G patch domain-containing protein [Dufourea novaeangliae]